MLTTKPHYSIGEVAKEFGIPASTLRFLETKFSILKPYAPNGTRRYDAHDIEQIRLIKFLLYEKKMTIEGANEFIHRNKGKENIKMNAIEQLKQLRKELLSIKAELDKMKDRPSSNA